MARGKKRGNRKGGGGGKGKNGGKRGKKGVVVGRVKTKDFYPNKGKNQKAAKKNGKKPDDGASTSQPKRRDVNHGKSSTKYHCNRCGYSEYVKVEEGQEHACKSPAPRIKPEKKHAGKK